MLVHQLFFNRQSRNFQINFSLPYPDLTVVFSYRGDDNGTFVKIVRKFDGISAEIRRNFGGIFARGVLLGGLLPPQTPPGKTGGAGASPDPPTRLKNGGRRTSKRGENCCENRRPETYPTLIVPNLYLRPNLVFPALSHFLVKDWPHCSSQDG